MSERDLENSWGSRLAKMKGEGYNDVKNNRGNHVAHKNQRDGNEGRSSV